MYFELPGREWDDNLINGKHVFLPDLPERKCMASGNIQRTSASYSFLQFVVIWEYPKDG